MREEKKTAPAAVAGPKEAVAYLDIGEGGYLDLGSDLSDEALRKLPKGRHMLAIVGTYGVDGYVPVAAPTIQAAPVAQGDAQPMQPSDDDVICPSCSHQFRAIPVNVQKLMLDAGIAPPFTSSAQKDVAMDTFQKNGIAWAVDRWKSEVMNRPMRNLHRRSLDDAWRQVVRYFGGCPDTLLGPCHDASRAQAEEGGAS